MSQSTHISAQDHAQTFSSRKRGIALAVVALAFVMDLVDSTIVNIAIPSIQANLGASYSAIQWLVTGYLLAFAVFLITGGRMGDVFGYKKLFMIGVAGFTVASLLCGVAHTPALLVGARIIQGAMAALMVPQVMSLMQVMYKPHERAGVMGLFGALGGLAATAGPILGGVLIHADIFNLEWRPIFLVNIPIGIAALIAAYRVLPDGKSAHPLRLDLVGTGIIIAALAMLIFPLVQGRELEWPLWTFAMIAASLPVFVLFAWYEHRRMLRDGSALIVPKLFKKRSFSVGLTVNIIFEMAMLGFFFIFTLMLQAGLGFSVIKAALTGLPIAVGISLAIGLLGQKLIPKLGRFLLSIGSAVMALGFMCLTFTFNRYGLDTHPWQLVAPLFIVGVGMGSVMACIFGIVLNDVDPRHAGSASGVLSAVQQVGGAIGIAIIGVIFFGQLSSFAPHSVDAVTPQLRTDMSRHNVPLDVQDRVASQFKTCFTDYSRQKDSTHVPASCQQPDQLQTAQTLEIKKAYANATRAALENNFYEALRKSIIYEVILLAIVFGISFLLPRHFKAEEHAT